MNVYEERILKLIDKDYVTNPISYIHNTNYNKKVKSVHKRKTNTNYNRYITYTSYEIYRLSKLPEKESHLSFVSFLKVSLVRFLILQVHLYVPAKSRLSPLEFRFVF